MVAAILLAQLAPASVGRARALARSAPRMATPADLIVAAADGDIVAALETVAISAMGVLAVESARQLARREPPNSQAMEKLDPPVNDKVTVWVDLGVDGEPQGVNQLSIKPQLPHSDLVVIDLPVPLGLLIEETERGQILVTGTLPGYSAINKVQEDDILCALTAYAEVVSGAPMWQQVTSGTPMGKRQLKRLIFSTDGATYGDVRNAIASHRKSEGGNGIVTLVLERAVELGKPLAPRMAPAPLEPLQDVILRDLQTPPTAEE